MVMKRLLGIVVMMWAGIASVFAEEKDTRTGVFHPSFHTLQTKINGNDQLPPVIMMDSDDVLTISFDELASDRRYMRYELLHCNALWQRDALLSPEYVDGFNEGYVNDYSFSRATLIQYVHYEIKIPDPEMKIKLSGNYLLRVYDEGNPDETLLQVRFSVCEPLMTATASVTSRTDIDYNQSHQQLTVGVDAKGVSVNNILTDVILTVEQNGRQDNIVSINHPTRIAGTVAWWEHVPALIFSAGNEYRRMEIISTNYPGMGVAAIDYVDPLYHITLNTDLPRSGEPYIFDSTQKGRFRVREYNSDSPDTEADYIMTHFSLEMPELINTDIFLDGDFTSRRFNPGSLMVYNRATGLYEAAVLLKQGAYNYEYLTVPRGSVTGSTAQVEGDFYPTANEYLVKVYLREPGARYDRMVGVTSVTAGV